MSNTVSEQARATIHAVGQAAEMVADKYWDRVHLARDELTRLKAEP